MAIANNYCPESQRNQFIVPENANETSIVTHFFNISSEDTLETIKYPIKKTGYYCVVVFPISNTEGEFTISIEWRNPYGELPASEYPKLPVSISRV